jgi:hypothetical protein
MSGDRNDCLYSGLWRCVIKQKFTVGLEKHAVPSANSSSTRCVRPSYDLQACGCASVLLHGTTTRKVSTKLRYLKHDLLCDVHSHEACNRAAARSSPTTHCKNNPTCSSTRVLHSTCHKRTDDELSRQTYCKPTPGRRTENFHSA